MSLSRREALVFGAGLTYSIASGSDLESLVVRRALAAGAVRPFRRGINTWPWFSLTREYPAPRTDFAWPPYQENRAVPTARDLARLAAAGFDFIRLPFDPGPFLDAPLERRELLLKALLDAVKQAHAAGLGIIVNVQTNEATHFWNSATLVSSTAAPKFASYRLLVATVAKALGALGLPRLALEPVNEPPQECASSSWSAVQIALLEAARGAAHNLPLVATGACGSMIRGLDALDPASLERFQPLLFTFHFYEPYLFSHQGAPWLHEPVYRDLNGVPWPGSAGTLDATLAAVRARMAADTGISSEAKKEAYAVSERLMAQYFEANPGRPFIDGYLDTVSAWSERHSIAKDHIVMGEFGAVKTTWRFIGARDADRARYIRDVRESAEAHGFGWAFWNLFDSMGLMDDTSRALDADVIAALGLEMPR
ncbi:MAG: cellulase family glycosylhydrolase [Beijerinckiaceae bacterium]|nr:cellulase family glycosylhydrolase [Beijerinckiaceae bacterium]